MRTKITSLTFLFPACLAFAAPYVFDFGTAESPLHPGAILVTQAGIEPAVWKSENKRETRVNPITREWTTNKHSGKKTPPPSYQTELTCDHVHARHGETLTLSVPPGPYKLLILSGGGLR